ncbi:MAG: hypothetical protein LDL35_09655 [Methanospirillum hungatei]|nr:hypothetical protein [Methanospirillum hungatei]
MLLEADNITTPQAEKELIIGKEMMESLAGSPYVGKEAALIANISKVL